MEERKLPEKAKEERVVYYEEDEIDLYELWLVLKKRWKVIILSTSVLLFSAVAYIFTSKPIYESAFIVKVPAPFVSNQDTINSLEAVKTFLEEKRLKELSNILETNERILKELFSLSANPIKKEKNRIKISIAVYSPEVITYLSKSILNYLNKNKYLKNRLEIEKSTILQTIKNIKSEIKDTENLKQAIIAKIKSNNYNIGFNPLEIDESIIQLKEKLHTLDAKLKTLKGYEIVVEPVIPSKPTKPKKTLILAAATISGLFLGVFLAFFLEWIENAKRRHQREENYPS
ncbi:Wzz/FepE/Etk N-terminal domain-containing protein [Persephonella sp.]